MFQKYNCMKRKISIVNIRIRYEKNYDNQVYSKRTKNVKMVDFHFFLKQ